MISLETMVHVCLYGSNLMNYSQNVLKLFILFLIFDVNLILKFVFLIQGQVYDQKCFCKKNWLS